MNLGEFKAERDRGIKVLKFNERAMVVVKLRRREHERTQMSFQLPQTTVTISLHGPE